jgi:hypothetical protein
VKHLCVAAIALFCAQAYASNDRDVMVRCQSDQYEFNLLDNGYTYYSNATLTPKGGSKIDMECGEMMGRADGASWSCVDNVSRIEVTLYGEVDQEKVTGKVTSGQKELSDLRCKVLQ